MALEIGSRLGHYDVTAKIGEGGMGEVYRARDTKLDRDVALKILPEAFTQDPDRLARFEREAKVLASLNHPNIAAIYGLEEADSIRALVLELVEGPTLADRIKRGPIPLDEALPIAKQIAEALEAAHEAGVIHRDLKPANIKVREDGTVKVLDFGLAKAFQPDASDPGLSQSPTISLTAAATQMGMVIGTAAYMAPEQAKGKVIDKRVDVWAFGAVLYEMLTGQRAFGGADVSDTLAMVLMKDVNWSALPGDTPPSIQTLLTRCLEREPKRRIRDIGDVSLAMDGGFETTVSASSEATATKVLRIWQRPVPLVLAGFTLLVVGGLAVWGVTRPAPERVSRFPIPLAADQTFSDQDRPLVAISPDGSHVVYAANGSLWLRPFDQLQAIQVPGAEQGAGPFFSADGQSIGFWADGQLKKVAVSGGAPVTLAAVAQPPDGARWGADDMILYGYDGGVMQVSGASGTPEILIPLDAPEAAHGPQMLPEGEWVLYTLRSAGPGTWGEAQIVVQSVRSGERKVLLIGRDGRYLSTGHLLYALDNVIFAVPFDVGRREVTGGPVPLVEEVGEAGTTGGAAHFSVSTNGTLVYVPGAGASGRACSLAWVTPTGEETPTAAPDRTYGDMRVSPDGTRIAAAVRGADGNIDLWIWRLDEGPLTRLTFDEAADASSLWTPDSARVVFYSSRDGGGLFWKAADGTGEVEQLMENANNPRPWGWSADGRLVFGQAPGDIGVLTVEGERTVEMLLETEFEERAPALSPDGQWLAYQSNESGREEIYVQPFPNVDDGKWQVSTSGGFDPIWSPDGRNLFFVDESQVMIAHVETEPAFSPGTPTVAFSASTYNLSGGGRRYDLAADGERFIMLKPAGMLTTGDAGFERLIVVQNWFQELTERVPIN